MRSGVKTRADPRQPIAGAATAALAGFRSGTYPVLVATDIAARGIDVEALGHVVNFDVPLAPDDYIHRVGRTGRAEMTGEAFTFVSPQEEGELRDIERVLGRRLPRVTVPDFDYAARAAGQARDSARAADRRDSGAESAASGNAPPRMRPGAPRRSAGDRLGRHSRRVRVVIARHVRPIRPAVRFAGGVVDGGDG